MWCYIYCVHVHSLPCYSDVLSRQIRHSLCYSLQSATKQQEYKSNYWNLLVNYSWISNYTVVHDVYSKTCVPHRQIAVQTIALSGSGSAISPLCSFGQIAKCTIRYIPRLFGCAVNFNCFVIFELCRAVVIILCKSNQTILVTLLLF